MIDDGDASSARRTGKSESAFRTISEVAEDLDVPQHVLRFWESKFPQVKPLKRGGGRRYYRPEDVALLRRIRDLLYSEGYTIKGVQKLLREGGHKEGGGNAAQGDPELQLDLPAQAQAELRDSDAEVDADEAFDVEDSDEHIDAEHTALPLIEAIARAELFPSLPAPIQAPLIASSPVHSAPQVEPQAPVLAAPVVEAVAVPVGLRPEIRQELELLLDELEQMRSLLNSSQ